MGWIKILLLGLDNAGKTTLLHILANDHVAQYQPTQYPTSEEFCLENVHFKAFDLGGQEIARRIWKDYCVRVDAIVFVVDAADRDRLEEAKKELAGLLADEELSSVPFLILGKKTDIRYACTESELRQALGVWATGKSEWQKGSPAIETFMCSLIERQGFEDGFTWMSRYLN